MWCPGTSAIVTRLVFQRNLAGQGWQLGAPRWLAAGYLLPVLYAGVAYGVVWALGLGGVDFGRFATPVVSFVLLGSLRSTLSATGEEIGWRGFLVPALAQRMSFTGTAITSGLIWASWHWPLILFAGYTSGAPAGYTVLCFTVMVIGMSFLMAWLRLRSGSFWPAALLHASHNLYIQGLLDTVTVDTGPTKWLTSEFGAALAITVGITAFVFWRRRSAVEPESRLAPGYAASQAQLST
jgi:membrane protease YdiL (CAAX protease family)